jgi:hypothetical protein
MAPQIDRETARALVEAGYMPLADYVASFAIRRERMRAPEQRRSRSAERAARHRMSRKHRHAA